MADLTILKADDLSELDFDLNQTDLREEFHSKLSNDNYSVILVNNPITISWINNNQDIFEYLQENFEEMKTWVGKLATFTYFERTKANSYRHPLFKAIRDYE